MEKLFDEEGFERFFKEKLIETEDYEEDEIEGVVEDTVSTMEYDMENGDSLMQAFGKACRDLYIDSDGIESFI